jgi:K+-sensing histidine kinase KdpD
MAAGIKHRSFLPMVDSLVGALICGLVAVLASVLARGHSWQIMTPLLFTGVLLLISKIFGVRAGVLGTIVATFIFALLLFHIRGDIKVADEAAKGNLAWMLLLGLCFSFFFAPSNATFRRH